MEILIYLAIGIVLGLWVVPKKWRKGNTVLQSVAMVSTLFFMGVSLGTQPNLLTNLRDAGLVSIVFAVTTVAGSTAVVYLFERRIFRTKSKSNNPTKPVGQLPAAEETHEKRGEGESL